MRRFSRVLALLATASLCCAIPCTVASATEQPNPVTTSESNTSTRTSYSISTDAETKVYTGSGSAKWLHVSPWNTPFTFNMRMVDYNGSTVWNQPYTITEATDFYVGANVRYVYFKGGPGVVNISTSNA